LSYVLKAIAMSKRQLFISFSDRDRLQTLINSARLDSRVPVASLNALEGELARSVAVDVAEIPPDVVTMNSTVTFRDLASGEVESYTLVYPKDADVLSDRISVFAPIGTALLGYRTGDRVEWDVPAGKRGLQIVDVQQATDAAYAAAVLK
jgi:regulator of nucleoside diphosphate kinase